MAGLGGLGSWCRVGGFVDASASLTAACESLHSGNRSDFDALVSLVYTVARQLLVTFLFLQILSRAARCGLRRGLRLWDCVVRRFSSFTGEGSADFRHSCSPDLSGLDSFDDRLCPRYAPLV